MDKRIISFDGYIVKIAKSKGMTDILTIDEIIQSGRIGIFKALKNYNAKKGKLKSFIFMYIIGELQDSICENTEQFRNRVDMHHFITLKKFINSGMDLEESICELFKNPSEDRKRTLRILYNFEEHKQIHSKKEFIEVEKTSNNKIDSKRLLKKVCKKIQKGAKTCINKRLKFKKTTHSEDTQFCAIKKHLINDEITQEIKEFLK